MHSNDIPFRIKQHWARTGQKNTVPDPAQPGGIASWEKGFPDPTFTPLDQGGVPPAGKDMNGVLNELSQSAVAYQAGMFMPFDATWAAAPNINGYPFNAVVKQLNRPGFWISTFNDNVVNPDTDAGAPSFWRAALGGTASIATYTDLNLTVTATQAEYGSGVITTSGTVTTGQPVLVMPAAMVATQWLICNLVNAQLFVKTASGGGVFVQSGESQIVYSDGTDIRIVGNAAASMTMVESIAALKTLKKSQYKYAQTRGYYAASPLGGGTYYVDLSDTTTADNGATVIVATDGGRWKLIHDYRISILQCGGKPDDTAYDNLPHFKTMATVVRGWGGGTVDITGGTFTINKVMPSGGDSAMDWTGCQGLIINYGVTAEVRSELPTDTDAVTFLIHNVHNVSGLLINNPRARQVTMTAIPAAGGIVHFGIGAVGGANQSIGIDIRNTLQNGGLAGMICYPSGNKDYRSRNIKMSGYFNNVYYPANFQGNGDDVEIDIVTRGCGRSYFPYNVSTHAVRIDSDNLKGFDDVMISNLTNPNMQQATSGIRVKYTNRATTLSFGNIFTLQINQFDVVSRAGVIRDIDLECDVLTNFSSAGSLFTIQKYTHTGTLDDSPRGHRVQGIRLNGSFLTTGNTLNALAICNASNWTGDVVGQIRIANADVQSAFGSAIDCRGMSQFIGDGITFDSYSSNSVITTTNLKAGCINYINTSIAAGNIDGDAPGGWIREWTGHGMVRLTKNTPQAVPNGAATTVTLPLTDSTNTNPMVQVTPHASCTFFITPVNANSFQITHNAAGSVNFSVSALMRQ